jgi:hypothetical protein
LRKRREAVRKEETEDVKIRNLTGKGTENNV